MWPIRVQRAGLQNIMTKYNGHSNYQRQFEVHLGYRIPQLCRESRTTKLARNSSGPYIGCTNMSDLEFDRALLDAISVLLKSWGLRDLYRDPIQFM